MTIRIAGDPLDAPRRSSKVKAVAEFLDTTQSHVRQLVASGELESHTLGKRGVRVYWDSVVDYQGRNARAVALQPQSLRPRARPTAASTAADRAALASLKAAGCLNKLPRGLRKG